MEEVSTRDMRGGRESNPPPEDQRNGSGDSDGGDANFAAEIIESKPQNPSFGRADDERTQNGRFFVFMREKERKKERKRRERKRGESGSPNWVALTQRYTPPAANQQSLRFTPYLLFYPSLKLPINFQFS